MSLHDEMVEMGQRARSAASKLRLLNSRKKNAILNAMADQLEENKTKVLEANAKDVAGAKDDGLSPAEIDRLLLTTARLDAIIKSIRIVANLKDPIGTRISRWIRPNGLEILKQRIPIGVIGIIYESRPDVTVDAICLCVKTSNALMLRGGKEALNSNRILVDLIKEGGRKKGLPDNAVQLIRNQDHEAVTELVRLEKDVDLIIPRGGPDLIETVLKETRIPVIKHMRGMCHLFVDKSANQEMALKVIENAKCQKVETSNSIETVLVHEAIAQNFLPKLSEKLTTDNVELRGDKEARHIVSTMKEATEEDWNTEYQALVLSVRVVPTVEAAIEHVNRYGSHHSDGIIAEDEAATNIFTRSAESAVVYINASTRFTNGPEFGMGADIGVSTDKLHARGPIGIEELTTYRYVVSGNGQIRE